MDYHEGPLISRVGGPRLVVLCCAGHLYTTVDYDYWPGSELQYKVAARTPVRCYGMLPTDAD